MACAKVVLDTNILIDFLNEREPFYRPTRLLMIGGRAGEFDLWITTSQFTDLVYILSEGGKPALIPSTLERLRGVRTFVNVYQVTDRDIDQMLVTSWADPEDALLFEAALQLKADFLVTRNQRDFERPLVRVVDCRGFFEALRTECGLVYEEMELPA